MVIMLIIGWNKTLNFKVVSEKNIENAVFISVVVVMRNEEENILSLLKDIDKQDYSKNYFELLIIF